MATTYWAYKIYYFNTINNSNIQTTDSSYRNTRIVIELLSILNLLTKSFHIYVANEYDVKILQNIQYVKDLTSLTTRFYIIKKHYVNGLSRGLSKRSF